MKYFKDIVLDDPEMVLLRVKRPPKIETTTSGIILSDGIIAGQVKQQTTFVIEKLSFKYIGQYKEGYTVELKPDASIKVPRIFIENKEFNDKVDSDVKVTAEDAEVVLVHTAALLCGYKSGV